MVDAVERLQRNVNFWDYICIAARLAFLPIYLIWILATKPFAHNTRKRPWRRLLGDASYRYLGGMDTKRLLYVMRTTEWVYAAWAKWYNLPATVTELGYGARLLWVGPKRMQKVILYLHGGGYVVPMPYFAASFWRYVQKELESRGVEVGIAILNYTLIPNEPFPAPLRQTVSAVEYLLSNGVQPENIQIAGDSAGGNLGLALLSHMLHPLDNIPPVTLTKPFAGMYMMSPWVLLSADYSSTSNNIKTDVVNGAILKRGADIVLSGLPQSLTPYIEPSLAPEGWFRDAHTHIERFLITVGDKECMHDDVTEFAHRFQRENKETLRFEIQPDGRHDDPLLDFSLSQPKLGVLTLMIIDWIQERFSSIPLLTVEGLPVNSVHN